MPDSSLSRYSLLAPLAKFGLAAASLLLCLAVLEIAVRLSGYGVAGTRRDGNVIHHHALEFDHESVLNSLDLRDTEIQPKSGDEFRILAVGDSFTYGLGVEEADCFVRRTERAFAARLAEAGRPERVRIVNGGLGGGPGSQGDWLRETGLKLEPDLVVLGYFIGNDPYDDLIWHETSGYVGTQQDTAGLLRRTLRRSAAIDWAWGRMTGVPALDRLLFRFGLRKGGDGLYLTEQPEVERDAWRHSLAAIGAIHDMLDERGVALVVLIIPTSAQVRYGELQGPRGGTDYSLPNRILTTFLRERGIEYVDLWPSLRSAPRRETLYFDRDLHWTPEGHRLAAEILAERLWPMIPNRPHVGKRARASD